MSPGLPDLAIILVNWNTRELLLDCLAALPAAVGPLHAEVWLVDNGSTDGSVEAVRAQYPQVQIIANHDNRGFAAANNQAIRASQSRHVLLLNSDTVPYPGSLVALVHFLDVHPTVGVVGARLLNGDGSLQPSWAAFPTVWSELLGKNIRMRRPFLSSNGTLAYAVDWVGGACLLIRRSVIEQIGLLDEHYFMYTEEADWCYRVKRAGWEICYYPQAEVIHLGGQSSKKASARMKAELYRSKLIFFRKHYGLLRTLALGLLLQAGFLSKALLGGLLSALSRNQSARGQALRQDAAVLLPTISRQLWGVRDA